MKKLIFKADIRASKEKVWKTMLDPVTYIEWVKNSWPNSYYDGEWEKGTNIKFISPGRGGTLANLEECKPCDYIMARHIAVLNPNLTEDRTSNIAKDWIGISESYTFSENNKVTTITVEINTNPSWQRMFTDGWPAALKKLKEICER